MQAIKDIIFPRLCLFCREIVPSRRILCPSCVVGIAFLSPLDRCKRCFTPLRHKHCMRCQKEVPWYDKGAALFEKGGEEQLFLFQPDLFAKTIAAFFIVQLNDLKWPCFSSLMGSPDFYYIIKEMKKFLAIRGKETISDEPQKRVLYLGKSLSEDMPFATSLTSKVFLLAYTT